MSTPVEGKPWRYVWWCVVHDHEAEWEIGKDRHCDDASSPCLVRKMRLVPVGYVTPEWGNDD